MSLPSARRVAGAACLALALVPALAQLACFGVALGLRVAFPMDLEWMESPQLYEAYRIAHRLPVFGPPSQGYVPSPYAPLFHVLVAGVGAAFGFDYWNGRAISDLALAFVMILGAGLVARAAPTRRLGVVLAVMGCALVAAAFRPLESSLDLARVDTFAFAVVALGGALAARRPLGGCRAVALGVVLCAGVYAKQTNVFYAAALVLWVARRDRRGALLAAAVALGLAAPVLWGLQRATGGWFLYWMAFMRFHPVVAAKCAVAALGVASGGGGVLAAALLLRRRGWLRERSRLVGGLLVAAVPACVLPQVTAGGWVNNLIGLALLVILLVLLLVCDALVGMRAGDSTQRWALGVLASLLLGALYDPMLHVPSADRARDVEALHARIRAMEGEVLVPMAPFVAARDGKSTPQVALVASQDSDGKGGLDADVRGSIVSKRANYVVLVGYAQEDGVRRWLADDYEGERLDVRVQALKEATGREGEVLRRR